jgi:hypothetical protein
VNSVTRQASEQLQSHLETDEIARKPKASELDVQHNNNNNNNNNILWDENENEEDT